MALVTCVAERFSYRQALSYGTKYELLAHNVEKQQIKIKGDNGRVRWYPSICFDMTGADAAKVVAIRTESERWVDEWDPYNECSDVDVQLSDGSLWTATYFTYQKIRELILNREESHFWTRYNIIITDEISRKRIENSVHVLLHQGELRSAFTEINDEDDDDDDEYDYDGMPEPLW